MCAARRRQLSVHALQVVVSSLFTDAMPSCGPAACRAVHPPSTQQPSSLTCTLRPCRYLCPSVPLGTAGRAQSCPLSRHPPAGREGKAEGCEVGSGGSGGSTGNEERGGGGGSGGSSSGGALTRLDGSRGDPLHHSPHVPRDCSVHWSGGAPCCLSDRQFRRGRGCNAV